MNVVAKKNNSRDRHTEASFVGLTPKRIVFIAIVVGIALRLIHYLLDRSLWIDEAFVALNLIERPFDELLEPLKYNQAAPVGFLWITKLLMLGLGDNEYVLRLFPFLSAIAALFLFYWVAKWFSTLPVLAIAISLFALSDRAIYYAAELKQYSSDITLALAAYCLAIALYQKPPNIYRSALVAILGAIFIWISHPVVFVLAGTGSTLLVLALLEKNFNKIKQYIAVFFVWLVSFIAFYQISLTKLISNDALQSSWGGSHDSFMPFPPTNSVEAKWFIDKFFEIFDYPVGIHLSGIAALAFIFGCVTLFKEQRAKLFIVLTPVLFTAIASGLHKYPFKGQLLLFIIPAVLLVVAEGAMEIVRVTRPKHQLLGVAFVALLFFYPVYYAALNLNDPDRYPAFEYQRVREDIKPVLDYVEENYRSGDRIYVYYAAQYAVKYYLDRYSFADLQQGEPVLASTPENWFEPVLPSYPPKLIVGEYSRDDWQTFIEELRQLQKSDKPNGQGDSPDRRKTTSDAEVSRASRRVWLIFAHAVDRRSELDEEDVFLGFANTLGKQIDSYQGVEAAAYLYDFSP